MKGTSSSWAEREVEASRKAATKCQDGVCELINRPGKEIMGIVTLGIHLAKNLFALHGVLPGTDTPSSSLPPNSSSPTASLASVARTTRLTPPPFAKLSPAPPCASSPSRAAPTGGCPADRYGVYLVVGSGRMCIAGLDGGNVGHIASSFVFVLHSEVVPEICSGR